MIAIHGLSKEYPGGVQALKAVDIEIGRGEFVVVIGPSGAGKSTLLRCINGLVQPSDGTVTIDGIPVHLSGNLRSVRKKVGMIFQQFNLVSRLSVLKNVMCGRLAHANALTSCLHLFARQDLELAMWCLHRVGIPDKAHQRADQLSGGQQQRVGIARALAQRPNLILADEPVASLDPRSAERIMDVLRDINSQDGITMLISLHNLELAKQYAQRVIGLKDGMVRLDKDISELNDSDIEDIYGHAIFANPESTAFKDASNG
jgi:phosphonate transport system ATP-binding protein